MILKFDDQQLIKRHLHEPPSLVLHLYSTYFKFEHKDGFFSYKSQFKDFLSYVKDKQLPPDLIDVFNEVSCQYCEGCLIVEIYNHCHALNDQDTINDILIKRVVMRPTAESIWSDIQLLNEDWNNSWTEQIALEVEAQILLVTGEPLCLDPSFNVSRIKQKLAQKMENNKLMAMSVMRSKRLFPFEPSFGNISFLQDWRFKKQKSSHKVVPTIGTKKIKNRKTMTEPPPLPDGRKCVRTIRFERSEGISRKVYTVVNLFDIGTEYLMEAYVVQLKTAYGCFNHLICDSNMANPVPQSPSVTARMALAASAQKQHGKVPTPQQQQKRTQTRLTQQNQQQSMLQAIPRTDVPTSTTPPVTQASKTVAAPTITNQSPLASQHLPQPQGSSQQNTIASNQNQGLSTVQQTAYTNAFNLTGLRQQQQKRPQQMASPIMIQQHLQQLVASGVIPLATTNELVNQINNPSTSAITQQRLLHYQQQQASLQSQQRQQGVLVNGQAQAILTRSHTQQVHQTQQSNLQQQQLTSNATTIQASTAQQRWTLSQNQTNDVQASDQVNAAPQLYPQLSPIHQQQMVNILMRRQQLFTQAQQGMIPQQQLALQIQQLQQAHQMIIQQHQAQQVNITPEIHVHSSIPSMQNLIATQTQTLQQLIRQRTTGAAVMRIRGHGGGQAPLTPLQMVVVQSMRHGATLQAIMRQNGATGAPTLGGVGIGGLQNPNMMTAQGTKNMTPQQQLQHQRQLQQQPNSNQQMALNSNNNSVPGGSNVI
ncbi:Spt20 family-domain-containing protein [Chlamydoabsidia padenii]|nr:Spt20 family-domain-containing protein [Chlamydoabsidia padenii]